MFYPDDIVERVRMENDIVGVIGEYVSLKPKGNSHFGLCPFHGEHTPSFSVSADKQLYYCFGCGASGNVISFLMQKENYDFPTAIKALAERAHIELPEEKYSEQAKLDSQNRKKLVEIHKLSARFFYDCLVSEDGKIAADYLDRRGISSNARIKYGLGYSPDKWDGLYKFLSAKGYGDALLQKTGLFSRNKNGGMFDKFRNRLMFPIFDVMGNVIGFGGRILDNGEPKYLNSPETMIFEKSRNLYSLNFARTENTKELILVEGYMDVIGLYQAGFKNAVASLGTAFNQNHARVIKKYATSVILVFDSDGAGEKAASRAVPVLVENGLRVKVLRLEGAKDPDEYIQRFGAAAFQSAMDNAMSHVAFNIKLMEKEYDIEKDVGKIDFTTAAAKLLSGLPSAIERDVYISETSKITGISEEAIKAEINKLSTTAKDVNSKVRKNYDLSKSGKLQQKGLLEAKRSIILYAAGDKSFLKAIRALLEPEEMGDFVFVKLLEAIYAIYDEGGNIYPAELVNYFESLEEQREVADIFITTVTPEETGGKLQALTDHIRAVKGAYIDNRLQKCEDLAEGQKLIEAKRNLQKLYISL